MNISRLICVVVSLFVLSSCSYFKGLVKDKEKKELSVEEMYNNAIQNLEKGRYDDAILTFEEVESTYPYSKWATKSQIMSAYASYKDEKYDDALVALERFTKLHPGNKDIAYAYYLRALSFYQQISDVTKDQGYSVYADSALKEVIARFPESKYANDARLKLDLVLDHLAGKEVDVGRFYLKQGDNIAAINRFKKVVEEYSTTSHTPEALHRLVEAYTILGVRDEAVRYAAVLGYNYPESKWYKQSYKLLEGKKLTTLSEEEKKGKWYDFSGWKGLKLIKSYTSGDEVDESEGLIENVDGNIVEDDIDNDPTMELNEGKKSGISHWFGNLFSRKEKH